VLVALVIAVLAAGSYRPFTGSDSRDYAPSSTFVDVVFTLTLVVAAALALLLLFVRVWVGRASRPAGGPSHVLRTLLVLAAAVVVVGFVARDLRRHLQEASPPVPAETGTVRPQGKEPEERRAEGRRPEVVWPLALGVGVAVLAVALFVLVSRRRAREKPPSSEALAGIAAVFDEAIEDLRREPDPRKAVIAAYARMERALAAHGLGRVPSETPYEYSERIAAELEAKEPLAALTALFERAEFSARAVDEVMRAQAIRALVAVRDGVRAPA
jgi:hypothetical protein